MMYGFSIGRDVIGSVEETATGNIVLRAGKLTDAGGWTQTLHIVLTPGEAGALGSELMARTADLAQTT